MIYLRVIVVVVDSVVKNPRNVKRKIRNKTFHCISRVIYFHEVILSSPPTPGIFNDAFFCFFFFPFSRRCVLSIIYGRTSVYERRDEWVFVTLPTGMI